MPYSMKKHFLFQSNLIELFILTVTLSCVAATLNPPEPKEQRTTSGNKLLSRKRRYVAFPEGSSVSAAICLTIGVIGNPHTDYLSWAVNWGVAYDLPNYTWARQHFHGFKNNMNRPTNSAIQRRSRRDLYEKIELAIEHMGYNGHACIARALCESSKYLRDFTPEHGNMIMAIVKNIFSFPNELVQSHEPDAVHFYDRIYRRAPRDSRDCSVEYVQCPFSLLGLAFGKYAIQSTKVRPRADIYSFM